MRRLKRLNLICGEDAWMSNILLVFFQRCLELEAYLIAHKSYMLIQDVMDQNQQKMEYIGG